MKLSLRARRAAAAVVAATVTAGLGVTAVAAGPAAATVPATLSGVYVGGISPDKAAAFGSWRGRPVDLVHEFAPGGSWSDIEVPDWIPYYWGAYKSKMVLSIPMMPGGATLDQGARGGYDGYWVVAAQNLVRYGMANTIIRPGWEFNGNWFSWSANDPNTPGSSPANYAAYFRHIVAAMRSVPGAHFTFDWCLTAATDPWVVGAYPGDGYVDYVGLDFYDSLWGNPTISPQDRWSVEVGWLNTWSAFASAHGKSVSLPEWGLWDRASQNGGGGGDDPYFIQQTHDWIATHDVGYETYFETNANDGQHTMEGSSGAANFRTAAARYQQLWSAPFAAPVSTPPGPVPNPVPPPGPPVPPVGPAPLSGPGQEGSWRHGTLVTYIGSAVSYSR